MPVVGLEQHPLQEEEGVSMDRRNLVLEEVHRALAAFGVDLAWLKDGELDPREYLKELQDIPPCCMVKDCLLDSLLPPSPSTTSAPTTTTKTTTTKRSSDHPIRAPSVPTLGASKPLRRSKRTQAKAHNAPPPAPPPKKRKVVK